jgi:hypothetical protein
MFSFKIPNISSSREGDTEFFFSGFGYFGWLLPELIITISWYHVFLTNRMEQNSQVTPYLFNKNHMSMTRTVFSQITNLLK